MLASSARLEAWLLLDDQRQSLRSAGTRARLHGDGDREFAASPEDVVN
jgi:hypothetical protein